MPSIRLLIIFMGMYMAPLPAYSIHFQKDITWEALLEMAQSQHKLVFVDAFTTWCGPCKAMEREVFPDTALSSYFDTHFVSMQLNMESPQGRAFARVYPVDAYPSLLFIAPDGRLLKMNVGAVNIAKLLAIAHYIQDPASTPIPALRMRFEAGERSPAFISDYVTTLLAVGEREPAAIELFLRQLPMDTLTNREDYIELWYEHSFTPASPLGLAFSKHFDQFLEHFETYAYQKLTTLIEEQLNDCIARQDKVCAAEVGTYVRQTVRNEAARKQIEAYMQILIKDKLD